MKIPRPIQWAASLGLLFLVLFTVLRVVFYLVFDPAGGSFPGAAFWMGFKFDARFASFLALAFLLLALIPPLNPFRAPRARRFWVPLLVIVTLLVLLIYVIDFYHYDYLQQRLTATSLTLLKDAAISAQMVWQSYPVLRLLLALVLLVLLAAWGYRRFYRRMTAKPKAPVRRRGLWYAAFLLLLLAGIWGSVSQFALRWSNAFSFNNNFEGQLALTPFETFLNTLKFRGKAYDEKRIQDSYERMAAFLGADRPNKGTLDYSRSITPAPGLNLPKGMNVVLVICESFSAYKSSMWGNPLNSTPYFKSLCDSGVFFRNCFTPSHGTARGVWATLTGLPDVERLETSSRNPAIVDQHILINDFAGYSKYYFIGGSASWANIRGLLNNNIAGLNLVEQGDLEGEQIDVWGISDKNLLLQAATRLGKEQKPFFAVIQTADNHRPYTIPEEDLGEFRKIELPEAELLRAGFGSNGELNAFRYTDFCYRKFMETARKQPYFDNTLFVFVGDHGVKGEVGTLI
ncbi:MAG: LTA synthase family protein, partial [Chitinophagaceae bacterium]